MLRQVIVVSSLLLISSICTGQSTKEKTKSVYGFSLGVNKTYLNQENKNVLNESKGIGVRLGIMAEYKLANRFYFIPRAELSYYNSGLEHEVFDENANLLGQRYYNVIPLGLEGKSYFAYKMFTEKKVSAYLLGGVGFIEPLYGELETYEYSSGSTFTVDFGFGLEKKFNHFTFSPEMRYSHGLSNTNKNPIFSEEIYLNNFSLVLIFKS